MTLHHTSSNEALYYRYGTSLKEDENGKRFITRNFILKTIIHYILNLRTPTKTP